MCYFRIWLYRSYFLETCSYIENLVIISLELTPKPLQINSMLNQQQFSQLFKQKQYELYAELFKKCYDKDEVIKSCLVEVKEEMQKLSRKFNDNFNTQLPNPQISKLVL